MKKSILLIIAALGFTSGTFGQIPNGGFENWTFAGAYEDPTSWTTLNILSFLGGPITTTKDSAAHSGTYAVKNTCVAYSNFGTPDTLCGLTLTAYPETARPLNVEGWYQLSGTGTDLSAYLGVSLTTWNAGTGIPDTVAVGLYASGTPTGNTWTYFNLPLQYVSGVNPDSAQIAFGVSGEAGSYMKMDDLAFNGNVASAEKPADFHLHIWPNPTAGELQIDLDRAKDWSVELVNLSGQVMKEMTFTGSHLTLETSGLAPGIYLLNLRDQETGAFSSKKVQILR